MSVPEGKRHKGRLEVHVKAQFLASYTTKILSNQRIFNPDIDTEIIHRIKYCGYDIFAKAWTANKIRADTNKINREMRYRLQEEAILLCDEMLAYIGVQNRYFIWRAGV